MRKIRVWDKKNKIMSNISPFMIAHKRTLSAEIRNGGHRVQMENLVFMDSIGLKDKNKKEIYYDSDIVEYTYQIENDVERGEEVATGTVVLDLEFTNSLCVKTKGGALYHFTASECRHNIEVVSNIYQQPE